MKKILFSFLLFTVCTLINAQNVKVEIEAAKAQAGSTTTLNVMLTTDVDLAGLTFYVKLPSSAVVTPVDNDGTSEPNITFVKSGTSIASFESDGRLSYGIMSASNIFTASAEPVKIATIEVKAPEAISTYPMVVSRIGYANSDGTVDVLPTEGITYETDLAVQKAAVIEELGDGNSVSIVPVAMKPGFYADGNVTALDIYYTSKTDLAGLSFYLNLPHAEFYSSAYDENGEPVEAVLNNDVYNNSSKVLSVEGVDDQNLKIVYSGVKSTRTTSQRYIKAADVPTKLATIYVESEESLPADIYTLTLSDITLEEYVTSGTGTLHTGKNYSTIIVGTPIQNEGIIYGYCTSSAASAISTALKNVAIADVTAATVDDGAKFTDVLVNEKGGNSYYTRTAANFATTVLPLDLTTENVDELYMIESMDAQSIVLTKAENVPANTPCIFKGTINVEGATPTLGVPSELGLGQTTFKGTYSATNIGSCEGYYIYDGKFYGDGASIRPFRGYFDGAIAGVKSLSIKLNTADGLIDITDQLSDEAIYSLQGIRMNNAQKGINIKGGKKVYVK